MPLRTKLLLLVTLSIAASVGSVAWLIGARTRESFHRIDQERTEALRDHFYQQFAQEGREIQHAVEGIAGSESMLQMALELSNGADPAGYVNAAGSYASVRRLDFLDLLAPDGTIISSAHWPARFGYKERWIFGPPAALPPRTFLKRVETAQGSALGLLYFRALPVRGRNFFVLGGRKVDGSLLRSLPTPAGMRVLIYSAPDQGPGGFLSSTGEDFDPAKLMPLVQETMDQGTLPPEAQLQPDAASQTASGGQRGPAPAVVHWDSGGEEVFHAMALPGFSGGSPAVLLVGNSLRQQLALERRIRNVSLETALGGVMMGVMLSGLVAARIVRPVKQLASAAREIGGGNWQVRVETVSHDEIGQLASAFNQMAQELAAQRERLVQSERVAAWRELARRLAHELKNPLFPIQITVENLLRARDTSPEQFDEVFQESAATLLSEIANLKAIIGRFSDFSRMPAPQLQPVNLNELVRSVAHLFEGQFMRNSGARIVPDLQLDLQLENVSLVSADPVLLRRVVENLILNAIDAMPQGGKLTFRTAAAGGNAIFELSDTGAGLTPEECERLFTPYYTTKQHGTGLGLAIVQSIVSDHGGRIAVSGKKDEGTTFHIELPLHPSLAEEHSEEFPASLDIPPG